jgi:hypothetical protein
MNRTAMIPVVTALFVVWSCASLFKGSSIASLSMIGVGACALQFLRFTTPSTIIDLFWICWATMICGVCAFGLEQTILYTYPSLAVFRPELAVPGIMTCLVGYLHYADQTSG